MQFGVTSSDEAGEVSPRRGGIQQQRVHCLSSDADYTSSSEQSCDTVIYVGKNGRALSDRELTDNEGPPPPSKPPMPAAAAVAAAVAAAAAADTSTSSGHRPTTSAKLSEVSGAPDSYHSNSGVIFPSSAATSASGNVVTGRSALGCVVQPSREDLLHRTRTTDSRHGELKFMMKAGGENASADCSGAAAKLRKTPSSRRGAPPTGDGATERWIDGPRSIQQFPDLQEASVAAVVGDEGEDDAGEMWVDGPAEFQKDPNSLVESHKSPMKLRKSKCAKLYRARAAALAAAAATTAENADGDVTTARPPGDCGEATRKDADISDWVGAASISAVRQFGVDHCQTRHKGGTLGDQTHLLTTPGIVDSVIATYGKMEELGRCRGHRRLSGRKQTNHITLASFCSPDSCPASAQSSPGHRLRPTGGNTTAAVKGGVHCGDRTAQWVRSVQVATAAANAGVTPLPSSQFTRPLSPLKSHSVDRVLRGCGADLLRTWQDDSASDDAVTAVSNNSPPPDYATCVAADLERRRRHSRRLSSPTANLDINENLRTTGTSGLAQKLLPISFTPVDVAGWSAPYSYSVETANSRVTSSGCQQPETLFDTSTWPRRQNGGSLSFAAVDVDSEVTNSPCKRLHHPDGASNPQLSEELSRSDVVDAADCCRLLTLLNGDVDASITRPTATPTSLPASLTRPQCCPADKPDVIKCRISGHSAVESGETLLPSCARVAADEDVINGANSPTSGANENPSTTRQSGDSVPPTSNSSKAAAPTRLKVPSSPSKTASPKRNKSSSGMSLLWCIHPRSSKSRSSKSDRQVKSTRPDAESADDVDHQHQQSSTSTAAVETVDSVVGDRSTDSDRGSSLSECTPPTALDLVRRLCNVDDDASSDYWSTKASADHLPSTPHTISATTHGKCQLSSLSVSVLPFVILAFYAFANSRRRRHRVFRSSVWYGCPPSCCTSVNIYFAWHDISVLSGRISTKLGINIHHAKVGFQSQKSEVKCLNACQALDIR